MVELAPSILSADFSNLQEQIKRVEDTNTKYLHLDVMDGHFVPNITFGPPVIKKIRPHSSLIFDVHLMIEDPDRYLNEFVSAGADILTVHCEACIHLHRTLQRIKDQGIKAGVALNPATPIEFVTNILYLVDLVLVMSVNPGFGGQKFIPASLEKIKKLNEIKQNNKLDYIIEVDGGINSAIASEVVAAGAQVLVAGSAVFKNNDIENNISNIKKNIDFD